jgi:imidazoleglycerol phosphate synthase glutamine amidotransferase subunit HisH
MFRRQIPGARLIIYPGVGDVIEEAPAASERHAAAVIEMLPAKDGQRLMGTAVGLSLEDND